MASGKKHAQATRRTLWFLSFLSIALITYYQQVELVGLFIGAILGHLITPDIDHHWTTYEEHRMYKINRALGFLWQWYWAPYQWVFKHRGLSHVLFLGTLTRFTYVLWYPLSAYPEYYLVYIYVYVTWFIQDYIHLILDI